MATHRAFWKTLKWQLNLLNPKFYKFRPTVEGGNEEELPPEAADEGEPAPEAPDEANAEPALPVVSRYTLQLKFVVNGVCRELYILLVLVSK
jgi:hypothetical protein